MYTRIENDNRRKIRSDSSKRWIEDYKGTFLLYLIEDI